MNAERPTITDHEFVPKDGDEPNLFAKCWHVIPGLGYGVRTIVCGRPLNEHAYVPDSSLQGSVAAAAAKYGPDAAIEATAQCLDITTVALIGVPMGVGDALRDAYATLKRELIQAGPAAAASSGAEHELAYYGGAA